MGESGDYREEAERMSQLTQGHRRPDGTDSRTLNPGEYTREMSADGSPTDRWEFRVPNCEPSKRWTHGFGGISSGKWAITEHEDESITVSPSIDYKEYEGDTIVHRWHGYLERGVWREC